MSWANAELGEVANMFSDIGITGGCEFNGVE